MALCPLRPGRLPFRSVFARMSRGRGGRLVCLRLAYLRACGIILPSSGRSSVGRTPPCQGEGHEFEPRRPLFLLEREGQETVERSVSWPFFFPGSTRSYARWIKSLRTSTSWPPNWYLYRSSPCIKSNTSRPCSMAWRMQCAVSTMPAPRLGKDRQSSPEL